MVSQCALILSLLLHAPVDLVTTAYEMAGDDGLEIVAIISCENPAWDVNAVVYEPNGGTSAGLGMLHEFWHPQYRGDVIMNLVETIRTYREDCPGVTLAERVSHYNGGTNPGEYSKAWGLKVQSRRDAMLMYLWHRLR